jgi:hypothetical protein
MKKYPLSFISGIVAPVSYLIFTCLSYIRYPLHYSPFTNWLSDLGNPELNLRGFLFYNAGILVTAVTLVGFFSGLSVWKLQGLKVQAIMLRLAQVFGILGSICMLFSGIYPINRFDIHAILSTLLYIFLSMGFVFTAAMLRYHPQIPRWMLILGISPAVLVILTSFLQDLYILEWIIVLLFLVYVTFIGVETKKNQSLAGG